MKRKLKVLFAAMLTMTMVIGMSVPAFASIEISADRSTRNYDSGIIEVDDAGSAIFVVHYGSPSETCFTLWLDDKDPESRDYPAADGYTFNLTLSALRIMGEMGQPMKPVVRYKWIAADHNVNVYLYTEAYYDEHYGKTGLGLSEEIEYIDYDTFKSEAPSKTVIVTDGIGATSFFDMKVHAADEKTNTNQKFLVQNLVGPKAKVLVTENIYPRRDLGTAENGATKILTWNNLPKNQAGPVFAVVYNEKDGAYVLNGVLDANGTAVFNGFKFRDASSVTICK